jgi:hypothetical protein
MKNKLCAGNNLYGLLKKVKQTKLMSNKLLIIIGVSLIVVRMRALNPKHYSNGAT